MLDRRLNRLLTALNAFFSSADVITPVLCSDASPVHPVLKNLLLGVDVIAPMPYSDAPSVKPVLKKFLLGT